MPDELLAPSLSLLLFLLPGLVWTSSREEESTTGLLARAFFLSMGWMAAIIAGHRLLKIPPTAQSFLWAILGVMGIGLLRRRITRNLKLLWRRSRSAFGQWALIGSACLFLYAILYPCALTTIPPMLDHDWDFQSSAYGLIHTMTPLAVTDRGVLYSFCDPPFLGFQIGLVALSKGTLQELAYHFDMASSLKEKHGLFPPEPAWRGAASESRRRFLADPHLWETRIPTLFYATASLPILFAILRHLTQSEGMGLLGCLLYFTFPEIFVRSSHGGYTAMAIFFFLLMTNGLLRKDSRALSLASFFGAIAKQKQAVILPLAMVLWRGLRESQGPASNRLRAMATHPAFRGYLLGTVAFFGYGLAVDPKTFWTDYVRGHFWNRLFHIDTGGSYPSILHLWWQFAQVQGLLFVPLAAVSIAWLLLRSWRDRLPEGVMALWVILGAVVFSLIDWRQTKHLMVITPALVIAVTTFAAHQKGPFRWGLLALIGIQIFTNAGRMLTSGGNLLGLHPSGDW